MSHPLSTAAVSLVAVTMVFLTGLALAAWRRSRNPGLLFVAGAFALFALKSLVTAYALYSNAIVHEHLEVVIGAFDLGIAGLLVAPLLLRRRAA